MKPSLALFLLLVGCSPIPATPPSKSAQSAVGALRPPSQLGADFQWRQQVTAEWPSGTQTFDAVLSKEGTSLLLVGLGPMDTPGFVLRVDEAGALSVDNHTGKPIPFDPKFVLLDVQRTFYPWFARPLERGQRNVTAGGESVTEFWLNNRLLKRTFERPSAKTSGKVIVSYEGWADGHRAPRKAVLTNGWYGYTLTIETLDQSDVSP